MRGDFSRDTFDTERRYSRVLLQQGRVLLDTEFNEQTSIMLSYLRTLAIDLHGTGWGPDDSFKIAPAGESNDFLIGPGRYYVFGILCENDAKDIRYRHQPDYPHPESLPDAGYLVYLDVWERHITYVEDGRIREIALGGPDTASRARVIWQARAISTGRGLEGVPPVSKATLAARVMPGAKREDPCILPPDARYRGQENQLYRVEIHNGGPTKDAMFKWSRDNGAVVFPIRRRERDVLTLEHLGRDPRFGLSVGDWVEIFDDDYALRPWADPFLIVLAQPDPLSRVEAIDPANLQVTLRMSPSTSVGEDPAKHPLLRRWDQKPARTSARPGSDFDGMLPIREDEWIELEDGVQIQFKPVELAGVYRTGDYWLIPARTATGDVLWPREGEMPKALPPHGVVHTYAPLAEVDAKGNIANKRHLVTGG